ncbi:hypothetical protein F5876DRAFT_70860 [Lentinula aff. lateritia]|uniref:Uncharacterized protein n=1 Tax=Lentinula aff. lateritia TaxID=2804960 RepID=A0ACC1THV3_9AGAR|nr:hypothetical protein F5876DRAFT_70860 [Lentinula aff. lateritia]
MSLASTSSTLSTSYAHLPYIWTNHQRQAYSQLPVKYNPDIPLPDALACFDPVSDACHYYTDQACLQFADRKRLPTFDLEKNEYVQWDCKWAGLNKMMVALESDQVDPPLCHHILNNYTSLFHEPDNWTSHGALFNVGKLRCVSSNDGKGHSLFTEEAARDRRLTDIEVVKSILESAKDGEFLHNPRAHPAFNVSGGEGHLPECSENFVGPNSEVIAFNHTGHLRVMTYHVLLIKSNTSLLLLILGLSMPLQKQGLGDHQMDTQI